jgi:hypothetical protein
MLPHFVNLLTHSWNAFRESLGTTTLGFVAPLVVSVFSIVVTLYYVLRQHGREAMLKRWKEDAVIALRVTAIVTVLVYGPILFYEGLIKTVYDDHARLVTENVRCAKENKSLDDEIEAKRQNLQTTDPAFLNMTNTIRLFMGYRRAIGATASCRILVTLPKGEEHSNIYMPFITFAVFGSNCPNGDLQNIGIKPENVDDENAKGMIPGVIVIHALPGTKGADGLADGLSNLIQTKRSYTLPAKVKALDNTLWIQFGTGVKWNTEAYTRKQR